MTQGNGVMNDPCTLIADLTMKKDDARITREPSQSEKTISNHVFVCVIIIAQTLANRVGPTLLYYSFVRRAKQ